MPSISHTGYHSSEDIARMMANAAKPPCAVCGRRYSEHNMGHGVPMCPIIATYRPKESA